jgi:hypothetical protein
MSVKTLIKDHEISKIMKENDLELQDLSSLIVYFDSRISHFKALPKNTTESLLEAGRFLESYKSNQKDR